MKSPRAISKKSGTRPGACPSSTEENYCSKAPILICPLAFTRGLPLKSTVPKSPEPRLALPVFSAGELVAMSKFGVGEQVVSGVGGPLSLVEVQVVRVRYPGFANTEFLSCPVPD